MAQIGQIVESNDAKILSSTILSNASSTKLDVTLKINQEDLTSIIRTFERYDYVVKAAYQQGGGDEDLQWRYDVLMNYLNF
jgi:LEA14-like dessication related protein